VKITSQTLATICFYLAVAGWIALVIRSWLISWKQGAWVMLAGCFAGLVLYAIGWLPI
jgi:hypothetical protein